MTLLQSAQSSNSNTKEIETLPFEDSLSNTTEDEHGTRQREEHPKLFIRSKSFCKGKFAVESNSDGYYLVNNATMEYHFLTNKAFQEGGSIRLVHDKQNDQYTIVRTFCIGSRNREYIVGYLIKHGGIMKFSLNGY